MIKRGYYVCVSETCDYEATKGEVVWGLSDVTVTVTEGLITVPCPECNTKIMELGSVTNYHCPKCTGRLSYIERTIRDDNKPEVMGTPYKVPIHSDALALTPETVVEHKEKFPDIEIDSELRPVFTNTRQHDDYMKECGIRKQIQKTGRSKGKIYSYPGCKCS